MKAIKELFSSLKILKNNPKYLVLSMAVDAIFLFVYGLMTGPVFEKLVEQIYSIGMLVAGSAGVLAQEEGIKQLMSQKELTPYLGNMVLLLLLLAVIVYLLYSFAQAINWRTAARLAGKKEQFGDYTMKFFAINALWFSLFSLYYASDLLADLRHTAITQLTQTPAISVLGILLGCLLGIAGYFAFASYAAMSIKQGFIVGFRKAKALVPAYLIVVVVSFLLLFAFAKLNSLAANIIGIVLVLAFFALSRLYMTKIVLSGK